MKSQRKKSNPYPEKNIESAGLRVSITPDITRTDSIPMDQAKP
jgi:hypothetical protein